MKKLILLLLISSISFSKSWKKQLEYGAEINYKYDKNLNDNANEISKGYFTPEINLGLEVSPSKRFEIFTKWSSSYNNYVKEQSALLSSPILNGTAGFNWKFIKDLRWKSYAEFSQINDSSFGVVKRLFRTRTQLYWSPENWYIKAGYYLDLENYQSSSQDGHTHWIESDVNYSWKWSKKTKIKFEGDYSLENRSSNKGFYTYLRGEKGIGFRFYYDWFSIKPRFSHAVKDYDYFFTDAENNNKVRRQKVYWQYDLKINLEIMKNLDIQLKTMYEKVGCNQPGYDYKDFEVSAGIKYQGRLKWK